MKRALPCFVLLLLCSFGAFAADNCESPVPASSPSFRPLFAVPDTYPWGYRNDKGMLYGLHVRFFDFLAARTGINYRSDLLPYPRIVSSLQGGEVDFGVLMDDQAYSNVEKVGKVLNVDILIVTRSDSAPVTSIADLAGKRVGFLRGWQTPLKFFPADTVEKVEVDTIDQGLAMLLSRRIDAMTGTSYSIPLAAKALGTDASSVRLDFTIGLGSMSLYMAKQSQSRPALGLYRQALRCLAEEDRDKKVFGSLETK